MERLAQHLIDWIESEVASSRGSGVVFGLSGGIDSAVIAALGKRAFPNQSLGVIMPCHSDPADEQDALTVARLFDLATETVDLGPVYDLLLQELGRASRDLPESGLVCANIKPRLRMTTLYAFANRRDYRVLGTGNASELAVGYFTKYGDGGVDLLPLGALTKTRVRELARHLGLPPRIIDKAPSAGLWSGQTDEDEMGVTYEQLDRFLDGKDKAVSESARAIVERMNEVSEHKRALPKIAPLPRDS